jgi:hemolysin activation/secretion protein
LITTTIFLPQFGHGWDHESSPGPKTLAAVGLGLRMQIGSSSLGTLYWGIPLRHVSRSGDDWLQNHGLHLSFTYWPGTAQGFSSR